MSRSGTFGRRSRLCTSLIGVVTASSSFGFVPAGSADTKTDPVRILNSLPVSGEATSGYSRSLFSHWSDLDSDGCDTREEVLIQERVFGQVSGCKVVNGKWVSQFDGVSTTNASNFDIDHLVPLKEAWDSGAWRWDRGTRQRYANDLGYASSLIAVSASSNRSKGARDPAQWLPSQNRCQYAKDWIGVKFRWRLSVDSREKKSLGKILGNCLATMKIPPRAPTKTATLTVPSGGTSQAGADPRFGTCGAAIKAGFGPYIKGTDWQYSWYVDRDRDGVVCE